MESPRAQEHIIDYNHSLLQSRPNLAKALKDFETFLIATQDDLQRKLRVLNEQRHNRKISRNVRTYLSLQNFLLQKHLHRLHEFHTEISARVALIFANQSTQSTADEQFLQLLADMSKMKTRCKHILDVTDRYCVLDEGQDSEDNEDSTNHRLHSGEDSIDSSESTSSTASSPTPRLNGNVIKTTVTSVSSHLAVIAKTYTKRHSSSHLNTSANSSLPSTP